VWYKGVVASVKWTGITHNYKYSIDYDDGTKEVALAARLLRRDKSITEKKDIENSQLMKFLDTKKEKPGKTQKKRKHHENAQEDQSRSMTYAAFVQQVHKQVVAENPGKSNAVIMGIVGKRWAARKKSVNLPSKKRGRRKPVTSDDEDSDNSGSGDNVEGKSNARTRKALPSQSRQMQRTVERAKASVTEAHCSSPLKQAPPGKYDILYDDGDREVCVPAKLVRGCSKCDFKEGSRIEGNFDGSGDYYPGIITRTRPARGEEAPTPSAHGTGLTTARGRAGDGLSSDGLSSDSLTDPTGASSHCEGPARFQIGVVVQARHSARPDKGWCNAVVKVANSDGSFDVLMYDGAMHTRLKPEDVSQTPRKIVELEEDALAVSELKPGTAVTARFSRDKEWYDGSIQLMNEDGTYHIRFSDGDREKRVKRGNIIPLKTTRSIPKVAPKAIALSRRCKAGQTNARQAKTDNPKQAKSVTARQVALHKVEKTTAVSDGKNSKKRVKVERAKVERAKVERGKVERAKVERAKAGAKEEVKQTQGGASHKSSATNSATNSHQSRATNSHQSRATNGAGRKRRRSAAGNPAPSNGQKSLDEEEGSDIEDMFAAFGNEEELKGKAAPSSSRARKRPAPPERTVPPPIKVVPVAVVPPLPSIDFYLQKAKEQTKSAPVDLTCEEQRAMFRWRELELAESRPPIRLGYESRVVAVLGRTVTPETRAGVNDNAMQANDDTTKTADGMRTCTGEATKGAVDAIGGQEQQPAPPGQGTGVPAMDTVDATKEVGRDRKEARKDETNDGVGQNKEVAVKDGAAKEVAVKAAAPAAIAAKNVLDDGTGDSRSPSQGTATLLPPSPPHSPWLFFFSVGESAKYLGVHTTQVTASLRYGTKLQSTELDNCWEFRYIEEKERPGQRRGRNELSALSASAILGASPMKVEPDQELGSSGRPMRTAAVVARIQTIQTLFDSKPSRGRTREKGREGGQQGGRKRESSREEDAKLTNHPEPPVQPVNALSKKAGLKAAQKSQALKSAKIVATEEDEGASHEARRSCRTKRRKHLDGFFMDGEDVQAEKQAIWNSTFSAPRPVGGHGHSSEEIDKTEASEGEIEIEEMEDSIEAFDTAEEAGGVAGAGSEVAPGRRQRTGGGGGKGESKASTKLNEYATTEEGETLEEIAFFSGVDEGAILAANLDRYPKITLSTQLRRKTTVNVPPRDKKKKKPGAGGRGGRQQGGKSAVKALSAAASAATASMRRHDLVNGVGPTGPIKLYTTERTNETLREVRELINVECPLVAECPLLHPTVVPFPSFTDCGKLRRS
jgi:hypothetical protein